MRIYLLQYHNISDLTTTDIAHIYMYPLECKDIYIAKTTPVKFMQNLSKVPRTRKNIAPTATESSHTYKKLEKVTYFTLHITHFGAPTLLKSQRHMVSLLKLSFADLREAVLYQIGCFFDTLFF